MRTLKINGANIRRHLQRRGIRLTIPSRSNERRRGKFDKSIYRQKIGSSDVSTV
ncbi:MULTISPECIES: hypothetical protein [Nostoc]|uniref:Transposase n=2 Tax=Nostoc TaxID=1177 RepID=A0ABR8IN47_9NOSO|nr:hypothetical protein [Nostoc linckia FACHB-391]MBD2651745.1 hypothetical protein [Nostoc foliaceum FACHB-393]